MRKLFIIFLFALAARGVALGADGNSFHWATVDLGPECSGYPDPYAEIHKFIGAVSSVQAEPAPKLVSLADARALEYPFLFLACRAAPRDLTEAELRRLRAHLASGGTLWVENTSGQASSPFDRWLRRNLRNALPESELKILPREHAVYRSFFLIRSPQGRRRVADYMEGLEWGARTVVFYSKNDLPGVWPVDAFGSSLYACVPGGEPQRLAGKMLTFNILMYALTGTYKQDAVHQPFLLERLRQRGEAQ